MVKTKRTDRIKTVPLDLAYNRTPDNSSQAQSYAIIVNYDYSPSVPKI